jgi:hypothetical protein
MIKLLVIFTLKNDYLSNGVITGFWLFNFLIETQLVFELLHYLITN